MGSSAEAGAEYGGAPDALLCSLTHQSQLARGHSAGLALGAAADPAAAWLGLLTTPARVPLSESGLAAGDDSHLAGVPALRRAAAANPIVQLARGIEACAHWLLGSGEPAAAGALYHFLLSQTVSSSAEQPAGSAATTPAALQLGAGIGLQASRALWWNALFRSVAKSPPHAPIRCLSAESALGQLSEMAEREVGRSLAAASQLDRSVNAVRRSRAGTAGDSDPVQHAAGEAVMLTPTPEWRAWFRAAKGGPVVGVESLSAMVLAGAATPDALLGQGLDGEQVLAVEPSTWDDVALPATCVTGAPHWAPAGVLLPLCTSATTWQGNAPRCTRAVAAQESGVHVLSGENRLWKCMLQLLLGVEDAALPSTCTAAAGPLISKYSARDIADLAVAAGPRIVASILERVATESMEGAVTGLPDLIAWRPAVPAATGPRPGGRTGGAQFWMFEAKSQSDQLSEAQADWLGHLASAGVRVGVLLVENALSTDSV
ncbi:hypothetical protein FNF28_02460 [Cafeteria roenbergensis]|uniref:VRR-NUC domain-containing protein n=1 Tax=Cafeteria roenbergensis TaxID=33653 RepID=A0A5A8DTL2_CAFRO|nr:hypothetical protein FNF28_02460 [Cafeteria roenbergensis]